MALLAIGRRIGIPIRSCGRDLTITEILSDSIVKALMEADEIDPEVLDAQLRSMAREISAVRVFGSDNRPTPMMRQSS
jgi:hypothetical protein